MKYRPEVDGLRAAAVIPVILFHAGFAAFSGGYVGVDVFFVISGYVITSVILDDLERGTFSLVQFYERRVRRIFPALFFMLAICAPLAWLLLMPSYMKLVSDSLAAVALFASNMLYLRETAYFGDAEQLRPLLHTWTLAVEEQYYLLFPVFMSLAWKLGKRWLVAILSVLLALSLALAHWTAFNWPGFGFYLLPARGWELGLGALAAMYLARRPAAEWKPAVLQVLSLLGLALIVFAVVTFDKFTPTPSLLTLVPTIGAVLVILCASPATFAGRLLGSRALVAIGLVSYSLYLWHQPIFVFVRHRSLLPPDNASILLQCVAIGVIGYLSWRYVERPFRRRGRFTRRQVFKMALAASSISFALGATGHVTKGTFGLTRADDPAFQLEARIAPNYGLGVACTNGLTNAKSCRTSDEPEVLVWGDSFAMHLVPGLLASNPGAKIEQATAFTCGPVLGLAPLGGRYARDWAEQCIRMNDRVIEHLEKSPSIKYVVMGSEFWEYVNSDWKVLLRDGSIADPGSVSLRHWQETLRRIEALGIEPVLVSPPPSRGFDLGQCVKRAAYFGRSADLCDFPLATAELTQARELALLRELERTNRVIWLSTAICPDGTCRPRIDGRFIYFDEGHLTREGSQYLGAKLDFYRLLTSRSSRAHPLQQP